MISESYKPKFDANQLLHQLEEHRKKKCLTKKRKNIRRMMIECGLSNRVRDFILN
jgi:hypothetical protein